MKYDMDHKPTSDILVSFAYVAYHISGLKRDRVGMLVVDGRVT
jgi:hypothetical protein